MQELIDGIAAAAEGHDRDGGFPHANFAALHAAGLLALTVPTRFGGLGHGLRDSTTRTTPRKQKAVNEKYSEGGNPP